MIKAKPLIVKPILLYHIYERKEATSWRSWGGIRTETDLREEESRISAELKKLKEKADFPIDILPISLVNTVQDLRKAKDIMKADVLLIYASCTYMVEERAGFTRSITKVFDEITATGKYILVFLRHKSGPIYFWYEAIHPMILRFNTDEYLRPEITVDDLVVDDYDELLWRLKSLYAVVNTIGRRIITIGGVGGWGNFGRLYAPYLAQNFWKFEIINIGYEKLKDLIGKAMKDEEYVKKAEKLAENYLADPDVELKTDKKFVVNAFLLYLVFKDLLREYDADTITVNLCLWDIIPIAKTTACLTLSVLNDEGYMAFCESDFVVIPAGILLHFISGKPVFLVDPTLPHDGLVTVAHCTAPRKMDGEHLEPAVILTHYESDYGAAPKVEMRKGQIVSVIDPDFRGKSWIGFKGTIIDTPFYPICRSQLDLKIHGDWKLLLKEMKGFHWILCYGDYLREIGYALKKIGINWLNVSEK